jgi:hypothetical protein
MTVTVNIRRDVDFDEYQVTTSLPDMRKLDENLTYFTDDPEDAASTSAVIFKDLQQRGLNPVPTAGLQKFVNKHLDGGQAEWEDIRREHNV